MSASVVVVVPVYLPRLDAQEEFGMDRSLALLLGRDVCLIAPEHLDISYYLQRYPQLTVERFASPAFESIPEYSRVLLSDAFYARFAAYEFMLVLQTDAILLKDDLDYWCAQPFDYVGAPWSKPFELFVNTDSFDGDFGRHVRVNVGNGGLSLRRIKKCSDLLEEFPVGRSIFQKSGSSEDLYFAVMGALSNFFILPNEVVASRFSLETLPTYYYKINGGTLPMGGHAWIKYDVDFWLKFLPEASQFVQLSSFKY